MILRVALDKCSQILYYSIECNEILQRDVKMIGPNNQLFIFSINYIPFMFLMCLYTLQNFCP